MSAPKSLTIIGVWLAALMGTHSISAFELKTIADLEGGSVRYRSMIGRPNPTEFAKIAAEFLGPREVKLGELAVYGSLRDHVLAGPRGEDHCEYETWRVQKDAHDLSRGGCPEFQEAIKMGDDIVIRSLDHDCRRRSSLVTGQKILFNFLSLAKNLRS